MTDIDFNSLTTYARGFTGLSDEHIATLHEMSAAISPRLNEVTEAFYSHLETVDRAQPFLEGRLESLRQSHHKWLESVFAGNYDAEYTAAMYHVGDVHVKVNLPVEFMAGAMTLIQTDMNRLIIEECAGDSERCTRWINAFNTAVGFTLMIMQESYQASSLAEELERFLSITGMSRALFDNLAQAYTH